MIVFFEALCAEVAAQTVPQATSQFQLDVIALAFIEDKLSGNAVSGPLN